MSEAIAPVAPSVSTTQTVTPGLPDAPPNPNMTGEEAKAWVEAQKAAKDGKAKAPPAAAPTPKADPVTSDTIKEAI